MEIFRKFYTHEQIYKIICSKAVTDTSLSSFNALTFRGIFIIAIIITIGIFSYDFGYNISIHFVEKTTEIIQKWIDKRILEIAHKWFYAHENYRMKLRAKLFND
jgi:hypothetical protein